jgi:hypothetical protein
VLGWININRLIDSSVHSKITLLISFQIESRNSYAAGHCCLENGSADKLSLPFNLAGKTDVDRQELHELSVPE